MSITKVELLPIRTQNGLIAFACVEIDHKFYVSSINVHKRRDGAGYRITYPNRKVGEQNLTIFHPTQASLSKEIERVIDKVRDYTARQAESLSSWHAMRKQIKTFISLPTW
ncbi:septation protein SpoVG family protein [Candidatus Protochlamydia amoebophila]|uniref:septation protein SpoVG family protein n=1 Tax=Candidatus Protochlamydia amoebophila TaxID=362787 RepID=UPI001BCA23D8|nr:septation protein SpoVG family protein [Candidatus Protochlamydia amoebophila]